MTTSCVGPNILYDRKKWTNRAIAYISSSGRLWHQSVPQRKMLVVACETCVLSRAFTKKAPAGWISDAHGNVSRWACSLNQGCSRGKTIFRVLCKFMSNSQRLFELHDCKLYALTKDQNKARVIKERWVHKLKFHVSGHWSLDSTSPLYEVSSCCFVKSGQ